MDATERYDIAVCACLESDDLITRAIDWAADYATEHRDLAELIVDHFTGSTQFQTWVRDVMDGEDVA